MNAYQNGDALRGVHPLLVAIMVRASILHYCEHKASRWVRFVWGVLNPEFVRSEQEEGRKVPTAHWTGKAVRIEVWARTEVGVHRQLDRESYASFANAVTCASEEMSSFVLWGGPTLHLDHYTFELIEPPAGPPPIE